MAVNINEYKPEDIDLKIEKRIPLVCKQNDNITLNFNVFDYGNPVDLSNFFIEFRIQQSNGAVHSQTTGITKSGNAIKIVCANEVTALAGKTKIELDFTTTDNLKKSSFVIIIQVKETIGAIPSDGSVNPGNIPVNYAIDLNTLENYVTQANALSADFATNVTTQAQTQASLNASVVTAQNIADSVANSLETANNLNIHLEEARALNDALQADITAGTPLKNDLTSINSTAQTTKTALEADIATAQQKLTEFENFDTSGLIAKVNTLQGDVDTAETNITNIKNEITTARNGQLSLKDGIIDLVKLYAPTTSLVDNSTFAALANDVAAARLGKTTLTLGIRDAINAIVDPVKTQVNSLSSNSTDTTLRSEVADARFGQTTLKLGIQKTVDDAKASLQSQINSITASGTGTDPVLLNEIVDARNGQATLKGGVQSLINVAKADLQTQINLVEATTQDADLRAEVRQACGEGSLKTKLDTMDSTAASATQAVANNVSTIQSDINSCKGGFPSITLASGVQNMIDTALDNFEIPAEAITLEMVDDININIMTTMVAIEKGTRKRFNNLSDNMRVETFMDNDNYLTIQGGVYDQENAQIKSKNVTLDYLAFCFD
jgi:uncharacterized protein YdcH (DUF465 family)/ribosomal protein S18